MRFTTKTEYGLICLTNMALSYGKKEVIPLPEIVSEEHYPLPFIEKVFHVLREAGIVNSHPGNGGGYSLARPPQEITLRQIVDALEGATFDVFCDAPQRENIVCNHLCLCGMKPVWKRTKEMLDQYYESITLEMITKHETVTGSRPRELLRR